MNQRGFTLIELSIVLVILGLIVGGIVGGKALIHQAELQSVVREANGLKTAINAFLMQYDYYPGDMPDAVNVQYFGTIPPANYCKDPNGDGHVERSEGCSAFYVLGKAEILPDSYQYGFIDAAVIPGVNIMKSKISGAGYSILGYEAGQYDAVYGNRGSYIELGIPNGEPNPWYGVFFAKDARSIDNKLDDGNPGAGAVYASSDDWTDECVTKVFQQMPPVAYVLDDTTNKCRMEFFF